MSRIQTAAHFAARSVAENDGGQSAYLLADRVQVTPSVSWMAVQGGSILVNPRAERNALPSLKGALERRMRELIAR